MEQKVVSDIIEKSNQDYSRYFLYMFMMKLIGDRMYKKIVNE